jgi:hypothetical protein
MLSNSHRSTEHPRHPLQLPLSLVRDRRQRHPRRPPPVPGATEPPPTQLLREVAEKTSLRRQDNPSPLATALVSLPNHRRLPVPSPSVSPVRVQKMAPGRPILSQSTDQGRPYLFGLWNHWPAGNAGQPPFFFSPARTRVTLVGPAQVRPPGPA